MTIKKSTANMRALKKYEIKTLHRHDIKMIAIKEDKDTKAGDLALVLFTINCKQTINGINIECSKSVI